MPLYATNGKLQLGEPGKLAAQRACCCNEEGDNPEDCVCPNCCMYQVEVVSPIATGARPFLPCQGPGVENSIVQQFGYGCMDCGEAYGEEYNEFGGLLEASWYKCTDGGGFIGAKVACRNWRRVSSTTYTGSDESFFGVPANVQVFADAQIYINIQCDASFPSGPKYFLALTFVIAATVGTEQDSKQRSGVLFIRTLNNHEIQSPQCFKKSNATCEGDSSSLRTAFLQTPLTFTVSWDDPNGLTWGFDDKFAEYGDQTDINNCVQAIKNNFSATFRITQRQSCRIVACNCSTSLDGLKATFEGKEFTLGTEFPYSDLFDDYELVTTHYKDLSGNYVFEKYQVVAAPAGAIGDVQMVVIYCETDDQADPPVPRWYARYESICRTYEAGGTGVVLEETKKTEIGYLPCSESAGCAGRAEGDPVPLGSPIDVEEIEGSPETTDGTTACTPPARANISIFENCG